MHFFCRLAVVIFLTMPWKAYAGVEMGVVITETANIYESTSTRSGVVSTLRRDTYVAVFSKTGKWYKVLISTQGNQAVYGWMKQVEVRVLAADERPGISPPE